MAAQQSPPGKAIRWRAESHKALKWPDDYWPKSPAPREAQQWTASIRGFHEDMSEFERLLDDPKRDLTEPFPWGKGQTLLGEALLIIDHNSHHLGQLLLVRRALERTGQ